MIYTQQQFGELLQHKVSIKEDIVSISDWAYKIYLEWPNPNDIDFLQLLLRLSLMKNDPNFILSYEELGKIASNLIISTIKKYNVLYTQQQFGQILKYKVSIKEDIVSISDWAYKIYLEWPNPNDIDFLQLLLDLSTMELGTEFALTYKELNKIADNLIVGKNIKLG